MMKGSIKKLGVLLGIMLTVVLGGALLTVLVNEQGKQKEGNRFTVVTSFYPVYIAAKNLVEGVDGVTLVNMTENQGTCLHDYQISTEDMKKLETADVLLINGAGMESFVDVIQKAYPDLAVVDSSLGISLVSSGDSEEDDGEAKEQEDDGHNHGAENGHIWMDPSRYQKQVENICRGLTEADPGHTRKYEENEKAYLAQIEEIRKEWEGLKEKAGQGLETEIVTFHDAFVYLAELLGVKVAHSVDLDADMALSAGEAAEIIEEIQERQVNYLFTEKELNDAVVERIAEETGTKILTLDSLVGGADNKDAYLDGMHENMKAIQKLLAEDQSGK